MSSQKTGAKPKKTILFCIPTFNEADSIGQVAMVIDQGLSKYFKGHRTFIINADNNSPDNTKSAFLKTPTKNKKIYLGSNDRGKGRNMRAAFEYAQKIKADAIGFIDGDITSAKPEWIQKLITPILHGYDHVLPIYVRGKYDGILTNHLVVPIFHGMLNTDICQPIGGEFGFSREATETFLSRRWPKSAYYYGIDIFLTTESIFHDLKMAQVFLGTKTHKSSIPKIGPMFLEVAGTLFRQLANHQAYWRKGKVKKKSIELLAKATGSRLEQKTPPDYEHLKNIALAQYRSCRKDILKIWPRYAVELRILLQEAEQGNFSVRPELWAELLYSFIDKGGGFKVKELLALRAVFLIKLLTFYDYIADKSPGEAEAEVRRQVEILHATFVNNGLGSVQSGGQTTNRRVLQRARLSLPEVKSSR